MTRKKRSYGVFSNTANRVVMVAWLAGVLALGATKYLAVVSALVAGVIRTW